MQARQYRSTTTKALSCGTGRRYSWNGKKTLESLQLCYFQSKTNGFIEEAEEETCVRYGTQRGRQNVDEILDLFGFI